MRPLCSLVALAFCLLLGCEGSQLPGVDEDQNESAEDPSSGQVCPAGECLIPGPDPDCGPCPAEESPALPPIADPCAPSMVVDFERPAGGALEEGLPVTDQYWESHGMRFEILGGGPPRLARFGAPMTAFTSDIVRDPCDGGLRESADELLPGLAARGGQTFLAPADRGETRPLLLRFRTPTNGASGEIYDIDHGESWLIEALGPDEEVLEAINLGPFEENDNPWEKRSAKDGQAVYWSFDLGDREIQAIRFTPTNAGDVGFDNFAAGVCPPADAGVVVTPVEWGPPCRERCQALGKTCLAIGRDENAVNGLFSRIGHALLGCDGSGRGGGECDTDGLTIAKDCEGPSDAWRMCGEPQMKAGGRWQ